MSTGLLSFGATASGGGSFSDSDKPTALNRPTHTGTGTGAVLTWVGPLGGGANNGSPVQQTRTLTNSTNGTITSSVQGLYIADNCTVSGNNITIKQCVISGGVVEYLMQIMSTTSNLIIEDCEIFGTTSAMPGGGGIGFNSVNGNVTIRRCNFYWARAWLIGIFGWQESGTCLIQDCWVHDITSSDPGDDHYECVYLGGGMGASAAITFDHNNMTQLLWTQTAVILMETAFGIVQNITINNNWLEGGGGYSMNFGTGGGLGICQATITNNRVGQGAGVVNPAVGYIYATSDNNSGLTATGNVDITTGANIDSQIA